jgi:hypothetical protein
MFHKIRHHSLVQKFKGFLSQGSSPKELSVSTTIGLMLGLFPVLGVTTVAMTFISLRYQLNLALMLFVSYLIYPLQIVLLLPFVRFGERLFGATPASFSLDALQHAFRENFLAALQDLGAANLLAVAGWFVMAVPAGLLLYWLLVPVYRYVILSRHTANKR